MGERTAHPPLRLLASRFVRRLTRHIVRDPFTIVLLALIAAMWLIVPTGGPASTPVTDSAEQYLQALRDRDPSGFMAALSPQARRALELRFGMIGAGAATAFFREQESRGEWVVGWERIGSYRTVQGEELRFYVVHYERGGERRDVPYMLAIDAEGKVARIE